MGYLGREVMDIMNKVCDIIITSLKKHMREV